MPRFMLMKTIESKKHYKKVHPAPEGVLTQWECKIKGVNVIISNIDNKWFYSIENHILYDHKFGNGPYKTRKSCFAGAHEYLNLMKSIEDKK